MSLNCNEIEKLINTFPQTGLIRHFSQPDNHTLIITYQPSENEIFDLIICIFDGYNHIYIRPTDSLHEKQQQNFSRYLNSHCGLSMLLSVSQIKLSRIVDIKLGSDERCFHIICRMWGAGSNILLTDDQYTIIECLRRYPKRGEWPDETFDLADIHVGRTDYAVREDFSGNDGDILNDTVRHYFHDLIIGVQTDRLRKTLVTKAAAECATLQKTLNGIDKAGDGSERYLTYGELIKNNAYAIADYQDSAEVFDYNTNQTITIPLDPKRTVRQNMQFYFDKYKKTAEAARLAEERSVMLKIKFDEINAILSEAQTTDRLKTLTDLQTKLTILTGKAQSRSGEITFGRKFILSGNTIAFVSKNAKDADQLLKRIAKGNDYWFHIRDYAGSHVIVKNNKSGAIDPTAKIQAAHLALYFSQLRTDSNLDAITDGDVYFTQIKYLRKPNTNTPGLVFPTQEKNIKVNFKKKIIMDVLSTRQ
ncbi:MAG: DUF814 domain-containing protein [Spirochaetales bacterium]|nr:DUF814 domain-containing protein [Spirochaetales bacterium]